MYSVYLVEANDYIKLEVEEVDFTTIFSVADVADISSRSDTISKTITFKGTKTNNQAFGSLFHLNQVTDFTLTNKLFFNYNPLRTVDCLIFEESILLFRGSLRVLQINCDKFGNISYETVVTGAFIDFKTQLNEKLLSDLNLNDLSHNFNIVNLTNSWSLQTERFENGAFATTPFSKGSGYVYPFIDYGYTCTGNTLNLTSTRYNYLNDKNLRPAVYVKEYFDRIFNSVTGTTFTYEVKGSPVLIDKFNSLIVPNNQEPFTNNSIGKYSKASTEAGRYYEKILSSTTETNGVAFGFNVTEFSIPLPALSWVDVQNNGVVMPDLFVYETTNYNGLPNTVIRLNRKIRTSMRVNIELSNIENLSTYDFDCTAILVARPYVNPTDSNYNDLTYNYANLNDQSANNSHVEGLDTFLLQNYSVISSKTLTFDIGERDYEQHTQFILKMWVKQNNPAITITTPQLHLTVDSAYINLPKDGYSSLNSDYNLGVAGDTSFDIMTPFAPVGIKQIDFVKSVINLFNFYVYSNLENPKHLIFQPYDDYYALTSPALLKNTALDWTDKIDYSQSFKIKTNVSLPKNYVFTYKDDSDFLNDDYKKSFTENYGTKSFSDSYGVIDTKKVELIFSATPLVQPAGNSKVFPMIVSGGLEPTTKKPVKSNIRILFYNGLKDSAEPWNIVKVYTGLNAASVNDTVYVGADMKYPQASHYYIPGSSTDNTATDSLLFSPPKKYWFNATQPFINANPVYDEYYINQTSDLTNPNMTIIEAEAYLNQVDIGNLNLRTPIFIDMGELGHAYFKVLEIQYISSNVTSLVTLQKIPI